MNSATIPVYNTEISRPKYRGRDLAIGQAMLIAGLTLSYWFGMQLFFLRGLIIVDTNLLCLQIMV
jgi:hypothetical protein